MLYTKEQIKEIIPYQDPFLWVDEIESIEGDTIIGYKQTLVSDEYFKGHFVDFPIMPGVLVVEGVAQTGTLLLREKLGSEHKKKHLLAYQVRSALFYEPIWPGDRIKYKVKMLGIYNAKIANFLGEAFVNDSRKCEVRFSVAVVDKTEMEEKKMAAQSLNKEGVTKSFKLPNLKIGNIFAKLPIIQGGMAVRVSLHNLAGNVAKEGGVGIIAVSGMKDTEEVKREIRMAREISGNNGAIGINIMGVVGRFKELITAAVEEKIDLIIQGAGFRKDIFDIAKNGNVPVFAIASSAKVAKKAEESGAAAVIVEGCDAGGHLGFPEGHPFRHVIDILKEVVREVKIPVIAAGGVFNGKDIVEMLRTGASGVQMATRFVATEECDADLKFKEAYIKAKEEDIVIIHSPVGLPGRAIKTAFVEKLLSGNAPKVNPIECEGCIGPVCDKSYCILKALENARKGDLENGLVFAGANAWKINKIVKVKDLIKELVEEAEQILIKEPLIKTI
ncbi:MAG: nitronate monooxygenase [Candidatus Paceibacterota bacterium]|jgi:NAD(P)H-dependent flavin oxidoreductase YrpB (nitropropane dioxygenase family)/3-hydroxymyristoyl/3-hydroxydecanoyl-(acyl carrier protein) dehydratase